MPETESELRAFYQFATLTSPPRPCRFFGPGDGIALAALASAAYASPEARGALGLVFAAADRRDAKERERDRFFLAVKTVKLPLSGVYGVRHDVSPVDYSQYMWTAAGRRAAEKG